MAKERAVYSKASKGDGDMKRKYNERKLARLILGALLMGGAVFAPGVAMAAEVTWTGDFYIDGSDKPFPVPGTVTPEDDAIKLLKTDAGNIEGYIENTFVMQGYKTLTLSGAGNAGLDQVAAGSQLRGVVEDFTLNVNGGTWNSVCGAVTAMGTVSKNTVNISGSTTLGTVFGGYGYGVDGFSYGSATENIVNIKGGSGYMTIAGGYSEHGNATGNIVNLSGGDLSGANVFGGNAYGGAASDNIVNVLKQLTIGHINGGGSDNSSTGNTLNIAAKGVVVTGNINYVQNLNFYLPSDIAANDPVPMLTVQGGAFNSETDLKGVTIGAAALTGVNLVKGNTVTLITNPNGLTTDATTDMSNEVSASLGEASFLTPNNLATDTKYTLGISKEGENAIIATVTDVKEEPGGGGTEGGGSTDSVTNDRLKSPVETKAATVTLLNAGADLLASQGFAQAANAVALEAAAQASGEQGAATPTSNSFTPFAAFGGSSMRAESGSHVDTKGFGINVGFAKEFTNSQGKLLFGPVVEYGGGKYDSYNNDIHADGNSHYWGIGLMARQVNHDGFYYEGSVRGGRVTSDYNAQLSDVTHASYDSSSNYWAAHLGLGKVFAAGKQNTVDAYLKYFYSHQSGDDTTIHLTGGDQQASFDSIDSNRIRIGARLTHKVNEMNSFYGGLAYQYEFGGEARAHYAGLGEAPSPSVKGSSGMLELGWQVKPGEGPLTLDLGVTGWAGKQRGGSVQLGATWSF